MFPKKNIKIILVIIIIIFIVFLGWLFLESTKPLPGTKVDDLGRDHVAVGTQVSYNSNPPTSGPHFEDWVRAGVYDEVKEDGFLVHSLEHGYVIISYNCDHQEISNFKFLISNAYAHEGEEVNPSGQMSSPSATLSENFKSEDCNELKNQLSNIVKVKGGKKLIVVPRPNLDTQIALTAWQFIDKFDPSTGSGLSVKEIERIEKFIDAHLNNGPEKTME